MGQEHIQPEEGIPDGTATLTTSQAAQLLQVDVRTVERRVAAGQIPGSFRFGGARRFIRKVVERWIEQGCPPVER
ncbi:MAG: helix-turn-helix domain-containing protein [Gemmataceae bacterium]|nr:helix-turn-helix domain-containing protein [Gemmataceae bacterium]